MITIGLPHIYEKEAFKNYVNAIHAVGAVALPLEITADEEEIRRQIAKCDGIILIGGADLPPHLYGESLHPAVRMLSKEKADYYMGLTRIVLQETNKPVLGICLGNQALNVFFGGTLISDIYSQVPGTLWHSRPLHNNSLETMHDVTFTQESPLTDIIGASGINANSSHHQAIKQLGKGLKAIAFAKDGIIEGICNDNFKERFILGVQWHPERLFDKIDGHKKIFQALVDACTSSLQVCTPSRTLIRGGEICDGTGTDIRRQDILIENGRILAMLPPDTPVSDATVIDATGQLVAPGFIDAHSHFDLTKLSHPKNLTKLLQGVTTEVLGNCGSCPICVPGKTENVSWANLAEYAQILDNSGQSTNSVVLAGHNNIRLAVMGNDNRKPTDEEIKKMKSLIRNALEQGAAGISSGLTYFPGKFADTQELIALASVLDGRIYASHIRSEGDALLEAADEAITIAEKAGCRLQFSHIKTMFPRNFHKAKDYIAKIEAARDRGIPVFADRYPYIHSQTHLRQILPPPFDKIAAISEYISESAEHYQEVSESLKHSPRDLSTTIILTSPYRGQLLPDAAAKAGKSMEDFATDLLRDLPNCSAAYKAMSEENLALFLAQPWVCAGSDGISSPLDNPNSFGHPRSVGTFPQFFRMVAANFGVAEAVRKMTSLPATIFNIPDRGILRQGYVADIVILDSDKFCTKADFAGENLKPIGLKQVFVNGTLTYDCQHPDKIGTAGRYIPIR